MYEDKRIIAVMTEGCDLNIHAYDVNEIELTMEEEQTDDEYDAIKVILSQSYDLSSIQWHEIKQINFKL